jgi:quaternary ammonium compound-resistance protein SugE
MAWLLVIVAGLLETCWVVGLKYSEGFTKFWPSVFTALAIALSMYLISVAAQSLPMGTAYGVWVGIGAAGAAIFGIVWLGEPATVARIAFLALLLIAIVGLKMTG